MIEQLKYKTLKGCLDTRTHLNNIQVVSLEGGRSSKFWLVYEL